MEDTQFGDWIIHSYKVDRSPCFYLGGPWKATATNVKTGQTIESSLWGDPGKESGAREEVKSIISGLR